MVGSNGDGLADCVALLVVVFSADDGAAEILSVDFAVAATISVLVAAWALLAETRNAAAAAARASTPHPTAPQCLGSDRFAPDKSSAPTERRGQCLMVSCTMY